jgi:hypothetical protein
MDRRVVDAREFGHPAPNVRAARVELAPLRNRIEDPEIRRGVGTAAGHPLAIPPLPDGCRCSVSSVRDVICHQM